MTYTHANTSTTCCCERVRNTAAAHLNNLDADLYRWSGGARCTSPILECWAESSLATDTGENQSAEPCDDDVMRSDVMNSVFIGILKTHTNKALEKIKIVYILKFNYSNLMHFESSKLKVPTHVHELTWTLKCTRPYFYLWIYCLNDIHTGVLGSQTN